MNIQTLSGMARAYGSAALLAVSVAGCDLGSLLDVSDPSRLLAENVEQPSQASALMNGLEADFLCAHGAFTLVSADMSDEFEDHAASGDVWTLDRRRPQANDNWGDNDCTSLLPSVYLPASRARWVADNMVKLLAEWTDAQVSARSERMARSALLAGFSASMIGATNCSAALDGGAELTNMEMFAAAEARFTMALNGGGSDITNAAKVGRARVRLYLGDNQGALADAGEVPAGFVMNIFPSNATTRLYNRIWHRNLFNKGYGVPEWNRGLMTGGVVDPRTIAFDTGEETGWGPGTVWGQTKYPDANSPMPIARWAEAQLIIAEIQGGQQAVDIINTLRDVHSLPHFASADATEIRDMVVQERQRELWLEGFRAYDIHRLNLPLFPAAGEPYQPGIKGGSYGSETCIPIPIVETFNNRTIRGG